MKEKFIPQFIPYWDKNEIKAVERVLSKDYLNEHKTVREFERKFAEFVGAKYCITCTSGTTALYIGLVALLEKKFDKIYQYSRLRWNFCCKRNKTSTSETNLD